MFTGSYPALLLAHLLQLGKAKYISPISLISKRVACFARFTSTPTKISNKILSLPFEVVTILIATQSEAACTHIHLTGRILLEHNFMNLR